MTQKIHLTGCKRYNHNNELFLAGEVYLLEDARAQYLLDQTDPQTGFPYFEPYVGAAAGIKPGAPPEDMVRAPRRERPKTAQRAPRPVREGRAPRQVKPDADGIESADAVTV